MYAFFQAFEKTEFMKFLESRTGQWITLWILSFIWGTSFILMKKGLLALPPDVMATLRIAFTFVFFLPIAIPRLKNITKDNIKSLMTVGFIGNLFPAVLFGFSETRINSALAGMLNATTPIFTLIVGWLFYKAKTKPVAVVGVLIGFIGALGLVSDNPANFFKSWNFYAALVLLATLFYGINTNEIKYKLKDLDALSVVSLGFFFAGPWAILWLLIRRVPQAYISHPQFWYSFWAVFILAFFSSFIALIIFNYLIKYTSAIFTASVTYLIPVFAIFWGLLDGEVIPWWQYLFMILTIAGVYLVKRAEH